MDKGMPGKQIMTEYVAALNKLGENHPGKSNHAGIDKTGGEYDRGRPAAIAEIP
jgi:hypothetical protein